MTYDGDDIRVSYDLDHEVSNWFWEVVERGQQSRQTLAALLQEFTREDLDRFQTEFEKTASFFQCPPFCPDQLSSSTQADETAQWIVSQGKPFVLQVWATPSMFSEILKKWNDDMVNSSYESVAVNVYYSRFGEEMPPIKYKF